MINVLIFEDDFDLAMDWTDALEAAGYAVTHIANIDAAIAHVTGGGVDVIIVDMLIRNGPERYDSAEGLRLLAHLDVNVNAKPKPIAIAVSGSASYARALQAARVMNALHTLRKPFKPLQLVATIEQLLASRHQPAE